MLAGRIVRVAGPVLEEADNKVKVVGCVLDFSTEIVVGAACVLVKSGEEVPGAETVRLADTEVFSDAEAGALIEDDACEEDDASDDGRDVKASVDTELVRTIDSVVEVLFRVSIVLSSSGTLEEVRPDVILAAGV